MNKEEVILGIQKCIKKVLKWDVSQIDVAGNLKDDYGADSLDIFWLRTEVEEFFDIVFNEENLAHLLTVEDIANEIIKIKKGDL